MESSLKMQEGKLSNFEQTIGSLQQENKNVKSDYKKACELVDQKVKENSDFLYKWEETENELSKLRQRLHLTEEELSKAKESEK